MDFSLSNGKLIVLDKDAVFLNPRAEGLAFLRALNGNGGSNKEEEAVKKKDLADYTDDELYTELDRISVEKACLGRRRDQYTNHTRRYWNERRKQVAGELRRRKLRVRKRGDRKTLPTAAHLAVQGREAAA